MDAMSPALSLRFNHQLFVISKSGHTVSASPKHLL